MPRTNEYTTPAGVRGGVKGQRVYLLDLLLFNLEAFRMLILSVPFQAAHERRGTDPPA